MPIDEQARTSPYIQVPPSQRSPRFVSLRWRVLTPIVAALMAVLMCAAYGIAYALVQGSTPNTDADLTAVGRSLAQNAVEVGRTQRTEVDRIAFTQGVPEGITRNDGAALQPLVEPLAALAGLDLVIIGNANGSEVIGLQRVAVSGSIDYAVTDDTSLASLASVQSVLNGADSASEIAEVERRPMLLTAGAALQNGQLVGVVVVGMDINRVLNSVRGGNSAQVALFAGEGRLVGSSLPAPPTVAPALYTQTISRPDSATFERVSLPDAAYNAAYFPFVVGQSPLGMLAAYQPDQSSFAAEFGRQLTSLFAALAVGAVCIVGYAALGRGLARLDKVRHTADQLAAGKAARTGMKPHDEIGEVGAALDRFAAAAQVQLRHLQSDLWQQRRQLAHIHAILESLPDGVIVQDAEGRVMTMNAAARALLSRHPQDAMALREWSATAEHRLGEILAPGLVALQESKMMQIGERILQIEAAAVQSITEKNLGMVLTLRDVTSDAQRDAQRDALIDEIANDVHVSITQRVQAAALDAGTKPNAGGAALANFAREIAQDARAMQRLITDYRELALLQPDEIRGQAAAVNVADLMSDLLDEWRPAASAAEVNLDLNLPAEDVHILGDDKRLLWALGNIIDNAIKYGRDAVSISARLREAHSQLVIGIKDEGAGIAPEEQAHIFERFYRGSAARQIPGTGQGLYWAQKIIAAHGGNIAVASQPGAGTHVSVTLALTAATPLEIPASVWDMPTHARLDTPR